MQALYILVCCQVIVAALFAGWELKADGGGNWKWGVFWLLVSIVSMVLVLTSYDTFVA
jgi:hypothetical protein